MRYKINIQNFAGPIPYDITVNGENFTIVRTRDDINTTWEMDASANTDLYSIDNNLVIWNDETILQYNGVDVLPTDYIDNAAYTTRANEPSTGTIKFGSSAPTKYYLGNKAVDRIYMGTTLLYKKAIVYTITANLANCTANSDNPITIEENSGVILYFTANDGYELPDGVELTNITSYNWDKTTGKLVLAKPTGNVTIKIVAKQSMPQLATPQNLAVENTTLSFDEVENAESYEVFVDNTLIGNTTGEVSKSYTLTWDSSGYKIYINDELIFDDYTSGSYTFKKGDIIKVDNWSNVGQITINGTAYTSSTAINLADQDIDITGKLPSTQQFTITIHT